jgi:hypothetical protein
MRKRARRSRRADSRLLLRTRQKNTARSRWYTGCEPDLPGRSVPRSTSSPFVKIDDKDMTIEYELSYEDLEGGAAIAAHIHLGQRATSGGVSAFLCSGGDKPACPPAGGTVTVTIHPSDVVGPTAQGIAAGEFEELVRAIRSGFAYLNVHSTGRPGRRDPRTDSRPARPRQLSFFSRGRP